MGRVRTTTTRAIDLRGLWVPVVTPLGPDGRVDLASLEQLARRLLRDGATGLVALGTTGEPATLTAAERDDVVRTCAQVCRDLERPLVVGVGTSSTAATVAEAQHMEELVAPTAVMVVVPPYTLPSEAGVVAHLRAVAAATTTPVIVYNVPHRTGRRLGAAALLDLAGTPGIVGLKQAVGGLDHDTLEVLRSRPASFQVLAGDDATIVPTILMGGSGAISAAGHLRTTAFAAMVAAALEGDAVTAAALAHDLLPIVAAGYAAPSPAVWKAALHAAGELTTPSVRAPLLAASPDAAATMAAALAVAVRAR